MLEGGPVVENLRGSVRWTFTVEGLDDAEALSESALRVMEALLDLEERDSTLYDPGVATDAKKMTIDIEVTVDGPSAAAVVDHAQTTIRTAIHAAGADMPNWPTPTPPPRGEKYTSHQLTMLTSA